MRNSNNWYTQGHWHTSLCPDSGLTEIYDGSYCGSFQGLSENFWKFHEFAKARMKSEQMIELSLMELVLTC